MKIHHGFEEDAPHWRKRSRSSPSSTPQAPEPFYTMITGSTRSGVSILGSTSESSGELETTTFPAFSGF